MDTVRFVSPKGEVVGELPISDEELLAGYEAVARARHFDERAVVLQRQGRLGVYAPYRGQEAAQVGTAMALLPSDWLVPSYRETAAALTHGLPHSQLLLYWRAHAEGWNYPEGVRVLPFYIPIATQLLHAVGLAMAGRFQEEPWVTMVYVGDGGTSEGDFHEALNFAAVYKAPVVFVVQNNGWAISVPTERQMGNVRIVDRAVGYGMPGVRVDGNDLVACLVTAREAVERARRGEGPTLIEAVTYRLAPHTTSDDPLRYRDEEETVRREEEEPLRRLRALLAARAVWDDEREAALVARLEEESRAALAVADATPEPPPESIVEQVFADLGPDQRRAWEALREG
ncbi:MAG: pyruvate dehydrogenase (acetyl-transferring) E1 component subunit alpha [Truepera sp.]|jgi:pyruvate dehydrogenase E1 component alpha subunit|nr:pyruvate dehydrogenase (acetyl-transferring) E1 component subunit alpha [Truepera sp.]HRN18573.1 pyruvate dehydrogenase (acetyl-transferring) E1 component subunit alpha [Trueperaceae bacterium]